MKLIENEKNNIHQLLLNTFTGGVMLQEIKSVKTVPLKTTHAFLCSHAPSPHSHAQTHHIRNTSLFFIIVYFSSHFAELNLN